MKTNYLFFTFAAFFAIIFFSCNSTSKNANIDKNEIVDTSEIGQSKDTLQQVVSQTDTINQTDEIVADLELFKTFKELTNSHAFEVSTYTEYDWSSINIGETDDAGCEIVNQKENDFLVMFVWQMVGREDTLSFQKLMETADYAIYAYNENGKTESPFMYHSGFFAFKRYKNGNWKTLDLKTINSMGVEQANGRRTIGYYSYKPENKTSYIHKIENYTDAGETLRRAGKIEYKFAWSDTQEDFIYSSASDLPNPILIHGGGNTGNSECANYYNAQIDTKYYRYGELKNKDEMKFAIEYERANDKKHINIKENTKNEVINNKDKSKEILVKYKSIKILECEDMSESYETEVNIIEDYEIIGQSPVVLTFTGFIMGDLENYEFTTKLGYKYYFNEINSNKYYLSDEHGNGPNPKFVGKKFKIDFHSKLVDDDYNGGKYNLMSIDSIELIKNDK